MIDVIMISYLLFICLVAAVTDWKKGKIYNKWLTAGIGPGAVLILIYYMRYPEKVPLFLSNLAAAFVIAILFFALKLWGAGDSKLWLFVNFLYPAGWYAVKESMLFPSMLLFMVIFIEAYLYIIAESVWYRFFRRKTGVVFQHEKPDREQLWNIGFSIAFLSCIYMACGYWLQEYYENNRIFFAVIGILLTNKLVKTSFRKKHLLTVLMLGGYLVMSVGMYQSFEGRQLLLSVLLVVVTQLSLKFADRYNYAWIPTGEVRQGMILSYFTVQQFAYSRVKGLPQSTDETTKSRISQQEAEAVRRWAGSKYGKEQVMIVRYIPFAIFILFGLVTYLIGVWRMK